MTGPGGAVELGELAATVGLGVVDGPPRLLEDEVLDVVDVRERTADLTGKPPGGSPPKSSGRPGTRR